MGFWAITHTVAIRDPAMHTVLPPLDAYQADLHRVSVEDSDGEIAASMQVAAMLWRIAQLPTTERSAALARAASVVSLRGTETLPGAIPSDASAPDDTDGRFALAQPQFAVALEMAAGTSAPGAAELTAAEQEQRLAAWAGLLAMVQAAAARLEQRGAFSLAESLVSGFERALPPDLPLLEGRIAAQRGRIARQLGDLAGAENLYRLGERIGRRVNDADLTIQALIGRSVVASMRGNYPQARTLFRRALRRAEAVGLTQHATAAHQGLLAAALAAEDSDAALRHGWEVLRRQTVDADRQAEVLGILGNLALNAGYPNAALHAYSQSFSLTALVRLQVIGLAGAAVAAAHLGRTQLVTALKQRTLSVLAGSPHRYENAFALLDLAAACATLGDHDQAITLADRATALAREGDFFEVLHRAEAVRMTLAAAPSASASSLSAASLRVIRSLETLSTETIASGVGALA